MDHKSHVMVFFFRKGEEVALERHRTRVPVDKHKHKRVLELKTSDRIFGIEEASSSVWNWWFLAKALSPDKIVHGQMRELCYSNRWAVATRTISDEGSSELNGKL